MIIGCPRELKNNEYRVGLTPKNVAMYIKHGHKVIIESNAGLKAGFTNLDYINAGAEIENNAEMVYKRSDLIVKVKEPEIEEFNFFKRGQILFTYLHLASNKKLTNFLLENEITSFGYETIQKKNGDKPCLIPMSKIAGKLAILEGTRYLQKIDNGKGILLGGIQNCREGTVLILGCGTVGLSAAKTADSLNANLIILDRDINKKRMLKRELLNKFKFLKLNSKNLQNSLKKADLVVCSVLIPGGKTPRLISISHLKSMKEKSVLIDVSIDQGGCAETSKLTTHDKPTYISHGIIHYCVGNMPGVVPHTSTIALTNATIKYGLMIADSFSNNLENLNYELKMGINTFKGKIINQNVKKAFKD